MEYVLLLVVAIVVISIAIKALVQRKQGEEGVIIQVWSDMLTAIGNDEPDDVN